MPRGKPDMKGASLSRFKLYSVEYVTSRKPVLEMENIIPTHILLGQHVLTQPPKNCKEGWEVGLPLCPGRERVMVNT